MFFEYQSEFNTIKKITSGKTGLVYPPSPSFYGADSSSLSWEDFYYLATRNVNQTSFDPFAPIKLRAEEMWYEQKRPYYNIYPSIIPSLTRMNLDSLRVDHVNYPLKSLAIRFPKKSHSLNFDYKNKNYSLQTLMVLDNFSMKNKSDGEDVNYLVFWMNVGEIHEPTNTPVHLFRFLSKKPGLTVTEGFQQLREHHTANEGVIYPTSFVEDCAKLVCTLSLMSDDPDIVVPDVLNADASKYEKTQDPKYIEKAKRRGKFGWSVGKDLQISPHIRAACPAALYWTGKGRKTPKIRFRKGCVVHKKKLQNIPTGYADK